MDFRCEKIHLVNLFLFFSFFITIVYLVFSTFITPLALNKSRQLLSSEDLTSFCQLLKFNSSQILLEV